MQAESRRTITWTGGVAPRLLDLFCGAGGAAMGYYRAGFQIVGVDHLPQPRYPFAFVQADALEVAREHGHKFSAIHASPPCQHYSQATSWRGDRAKHPDLIAPTRAVLRSTQRPYVIENVEGARAHLIDPVMLCGSAFGLPIRRHRYFELAFRVHRTPPACQHRETDYSHDHRKKQTESVYRRAMGVEWMTVVESREAIPPAYTEFLGRQVLREVLRTRGAPSA